MTTRKQHYVWKKYLEPWTVKKKKSRQLWCLRRDSHSPIFVDTKNVAAERDFYRVTNLTQADQKAIRALAFSDKTNPQMRSLNEGWISQFETFFAVEKLARSMLRDAPALLDKLDTEMIEFQELAYSRMESSAVAHLESLQAGHVGFFDDEHQAIEFSYFLAHQYFRTKAMRDRMRAPLQAAVDKECFDRIWPILRNIYATSVGFSIFANRKSMKLQVLHAAPNMEFITGDQPAVNTYGAFVAPNSPMDDFELFYPVSPTRAAIISGHSVYREIHGRTIEPIRMHLLNQSIERIAHEQLFSKSEQSLKTTALTFCKRNW